MGPHQAEGKLLLLKKLNVSGYGFFAPIVSGVDVSSIAAQVPSWAWPLILISVTALVQYFRNLADKRHDAELSEATTTGQLTCGLGLPA